MKQKIIKKWIFILLGFLWMIPDGRAITVSVTGNWTLVIDTPDLIAGPGSDFNPQYLSAVDQVIVAVSSTGKAWAVSIEGAFTYWHGDLSLDVHRTSEGSGSGTISGGTGWQQVTTSSQQFFDGSKRRTDVNVQYRLNGMSVQVPPDTYSGTITYTVVET